MKTKEIVDWIAQEQIINLPWINRSQINSLIPLGKKKLSQRMNDLAVLRSEKKFSLFLRLKNEEEKTFSQNIK